MGKNYASTTDDISDRLAHMTWKHNFIITVLDVAHNDAAPYLDEDCRHDLFPPDPVNQTIIHVGHGVSYIISSVLDLS